MANGFKMGAAFVDVGVEDNTKQARDNIGSKMAQWAGGLALGGVISKGITDNLDIGAATAKLGAQLDLTKEVSGRMGQLSGEIYRDNFGGSIPEVNAAIASVGKSLVDLNTVSEEQLKGITEGALGIASVFDKDVNEVVNATSVLVANKLAPDAETAMNLITRAFQSGGDKAGDLLETIGEYSPYFHNLGLDGATALGLISQGLKAGARDSDYIADAFKEFQIRAIDGSKATGTAFLDMGLDGQKMASDIAAGGETAKQGLLTVLTTLQNMKDPVAQNTAGVALFGTQWEDTLRQILPNMDLTQAGLTDIAGATDKMNEAAGDSAAGGIESVKRQMEGWVQSMTNAEGPLGAISSWALGAGGMLGPVIGNIGMLVVAMNTLSWTAVGTAVKVVASWVAMAVSSIANALVMAASWVLAFWPIALIIAAVVAIVALVIMNWDTIKQWTIDTWNAIWKFVSDLITKISNWVGDRIDDIVGFFQMLGAIPGKVRQWFLDVFIGAKEKLGQLVDWVKGLPGRILNALGDLGSLLLNAGKKIIQGLWDGLKAMWRNVTDWVGNIAGWISDLKGPIELDAVILTPHGNAFMDGLKKGLQDGFEAEVKPTVAGMAYDLARTPMVAPAVAFPSTTGTGLGAGSLTGDRAGTVVIENLTVTFPGSLNAMSKTDLRTAAEFLNEELRQLNRGRVVA